MMPKYPIVHIISSLQQGGAQELLFNVIMYQKQFEHHVIYVHDGPYKKRFCDVGIAVYSLNNFSVHGFIRLYRLLKKIRPHCIHASLWGANWFARIAGWLLNIPSVCVLHNHRAINGTVRRMLDACAPAPNQFVAVSSKVADSFNCASRIITNGIGVYSGPIKTKKDSGFEENHFILGSVGRFHSDKQYDLLLYAFVCITLKYSYARLVLMGDGPEEKALRVLASRLGISDRVSFIGGKYARPYYPLFDCFVQTSAHEGISLALLEAMSAGVSCIAAHGDNDHAVIRHNKNGILASHDQHAIAQAIISLIDDPDERMRLGIAGKNTVQQRFGLQPMIAQYTIIFNELISQKK